MTPRITGIDLSGIDLAFDVNVLNPYPVTLPTPEGRYAIDIAGSPFVESDAVPSSELSAGKVSALTLPARMEYTRLWTLFQNLSDKAEVPYALRGTLVIPVMGRKLDLPFDHEGAFPVLRPPTFSVLDVRTTEVSVRRASVELDVEAKNPNVFALGLQGLGYALRWGDSDVANLRADAAEAIGAGQTGRLKLLGEITAAGALLELVRGGRIGSAHLAASGAIQTPYGPVNLPR